MRKIHLCDSETPVVEGSDVQVNCGAILPKAVAVFMFQSEFTEVELSPKPSNICSKCHEMNEHLSQRRYSYGLVEGQLSLGAGEQ